MFVYIGIAVIYILYIEKCAREHHSAGPMGIEVGGCGQSCCLQAPLEAPQLVPSSPLQAGTQAHDHTAHLWPSCSAAQHNIRPLASP